MACFADVRHARPDRALAFTCDPGPETELLEEVVYLVDAHDVVPVQTAVARTAEGGLVGEFGVASLAGVDLAGPAPKAISRHGLRVEQHDGAWRCSVVVDV